MVRFEKTNRNILYAKEKGDTIMSKNVATKLNPYLSDLVVMYLKLHDLHWNVKGKMFVQVHLYTEGRYEDFAEKFDEVAEKIIMKGEQPVATIKEYLELASIKELGKKEYTDAEVLDEVIKDFQFIMDEAASLRTYFDEAGEYTVAMMLEDHIAGFEKELWFLKSIQH